MGINRSLTPAISPILLTLLIWLHYNWDSRSWKVVAFLLLSPCLQTHVIDSMGVDIVGGVQESVLPTNQGVSQVDGLGPRGLGTQNGRNFHYRCNWDPEDKPARSQRSHLMH